MRIASSMIAEPAALSVAPVAPCQRVEVGAQHDELVGLVGARQLGDHVEASAGSSRKRFLTSSSIVTGTFLSSVRASLP